MEIPLNLSIGELISRPNRFIFEGISAGRVQRWHCPVTGSIGHVEDFRSIPCLFTPAIDTRKRTTEGTVEAISLNQGLDWIGINQNHINWWIECFLQKNALIHMLNSAGCLVRHEVQIGDSRIDLVVENGEKRTFLELKTPMRDLLLSPGASFTRPPSPSYFDRGLRHFETLADLAKAGHRAIVGLCFMYDAPLFSSPARDKWNAKIIDTIKKTNMSGVENWQINLKISPTSLKVTLCKKLPFYPT
ncbi:MAG: DNA/RNA nuclease SfsA [Puniceicoccales bacterium]|jgi:sugar fermentation stimulation protein A|nr:DNA/RNA nuclease SfsA [Puniceicoccales bacterium]